MLYAGLDLSRKKVDVHVLDEAGKTVAVTAVAPEGWALQDLVRRFAGTGEEVTAVIESMNGAHFVHDTLELAGWDVLIADAARARALAPLTAKTDRIDAWVLAELGRRDLVPAIWLPDIATRSAREVCRFRQHLVGHRTALPEPDPRHPDRPRPPGRDAGPVREGRPGVPRGAGGPRALEHDPRPEPRAHRADRGADQGVRAGSAGPGAS